MYFGWRGASGCGFCQGRGLFSDDEDITEEEELVTLSELFECLLEDDAGAVFVEVRKTVVTAEGDEVVVAFRLVNVSGGAA
jgi:hypothetical protein